MNFLLEQVNTFIYMFVLGLGLGFLSDVYRRFSRGMKKNSLLVKISDFSLGLLAGVGGFVLLLQTNWGELRYYVIISIIFGFWLYYYLLRMTGLSK